MLVLNQFVVPRSMAGGTRHVELFSRLRTWRPTIVAGRTSLSGQRVASDDLLRTVPVLPYRGNGLDRVLNWASYTAAATIVGLAGRRPSVVYGSSPHLGAALAGLVVATVRRASFVVEVRDLWPQILVETGSLSERSVVYRTLKRLELFLYAHADRIVVLAEGSATALVAQGVPPERITFIPNGADPEAFDTATSRDDARRRYGFDRFTLVYAGAHGPANGLDLVVDAASELARSGDEIDVVLVGDGIEKRRLVGRATALGLRNLRFLDPIPKSEVPELLRAADGGLHCLADVELFRSGVSPNKLYDYMAAGLPVLTNTGGDTAAMVEAAGSGVTVAPGEIAEGARALARSSAAQLEAMGRSGRAFMEANRSRRAMVERLEELLDEVA